MSIIDTLERLRPFLIKAKAVVAGSSVMKIVDPSLDFEPGDIDIWCQLDMICVDDTDQYGVIAFHVLVSDLSSTSQFVRRERPRRTIEADTYESLGEKQIRGLEDFQCINTGLIIQCIHFTGYFQDILNRFDLDICKCVWDPRLDNPLDATSQSTINAIRRREATVAPFALRLIASGTPSERVLEYFERFGPAAFSARFVADEIYDEIGGRSLTRTLSERTSQPDADTQPQTTQRLPLIPDIYGPIRDWKSFVGIARINKYAKRGFSIIIQSINQEHSPNPAEHPHMKTLPALDPIRDQHHKYEKKDIISSQD
jgi:hypothetical protein